MRRPGLRTSLLALLLLVTPAMVSPQAKRSSAGQTPVRPRQPDEAVFVYDLFKGKPSCAEVGARLKKLALRQTVILSIEQGREFILDSPAGAALFECALAALNGRTVKALFLQDVSFLKNEEEAVRRAALLRRFVHEHPGKLAGAQLDVEPYTTEDWSCGTTAERRPLMRSLADLIRKVRNQLDGFPLGLDTGWWYPAVGQEIPEASPAALFQVVDELYLMAYGDAGGPVVGGSAERILARIDSPQFFSGPGQIHVALAAYEYQSPEQLQAEMDKLNRRLAARPTFAGLAVFHAGAAYHAPLVRMISGTAIDSAGSPLPGVAVEANGQRGTSNRCGQFGLRELSSASAQLVLRKADYQTRQIAVESLEPGVVRDLGTVVLQKTR